MIVVATNKEGNSWWENEETGSLIYRDIKEHCKTFNMFQYTNVKRLNVVGISHKSVCFIQMPIKLWGLFNALWKKGSGTIQLIAW